MFKLKIILITFLTCCSLFVNGQVLNMEKERIDGDSTGIWLGNASGAFTFADRQVTTLNLFLSAHLAYIGERHNYILIGDFDFLRGDGDDLASNGYGHVRANFFKEKRVSLELFGQAQYDGVKGMDARYLSGSNARLRLWESSEVSLFVASGFMYEVEAWKWDMDGNSENGDEFKERTYWWKNNTYISFRWDMGKGLFTNLVAYYQAPFERLGNPRLSGEGNLNLKITSKLAFTAQITVWYDESPVVPIDKTNYTFTNGVTYNF
ncbi:hypothetical protein FUAX_15430 [Fulvitalea axinellae]|uniref:DUF481 domain-containing protein n=1 Tax=Fulvitalea axinellae TaxID=1182444 RepID=A0AAU9CAD0_9BACT|nr:hypothetical protein FUAX_15430 [Fulvitalea axinellae]